VFFGANTLNQAALGNYALLQGAAAEPGRTFLNSPVDIRFRIGNADRMVLANNGNVGMLMGANPINFTSAWTASPDAQTDVAEICNDTGTFKTLMIVGNRSAGVGPALQRRVSVWDRLEVNGDLQVTGSAFKPGGGTWVNPSDKELKKNIAPIEGALEK